jgi:hypothetical protein
MMRILSAWLTIPKQIEGCARRRAMMSEKSKLRELTSDEQNNVAGGEGIGQSVSALAKQFGGMADAAKALGYPSVQALQDAIKAFT